MEGTWGFPLNVVLLCSLPSAQHMQEHGGKVWRMCPKDIGWVKPGRHVCWSQRCEFSPFSRKPALPIAFLASVEGNSILPVPQAKNLGVSLNFFSSLILCIYSFKKSWGLYLQNISRIWTHLNTFISTILVPASVSAGFNDHPIFLIDWWQLYIIHLMFGKFLCRLASGSIPLKPCFFSIIHILPRPGAVGDPHIRIPPLVQLPATMSGELVQRVVVFLEAIPTKRWQEIAMNHRNISTKPKLNVSPTQPLLSWILKMFLVPPAWREVWWRGSWNAKKWESTNSNSNILLF